MTTAETGPPQAPSAKDALGRRIPPVPVVRAATRVRKLIGRAHDGLTVPFQLVLERLFGLVDTKALFAAVELRLPDLLAEGPRTSAALAEAVGANPDAVERVLRFLRSRGIFDRDRRGRWRNNAASEVLREDHPHSWRPWVTFFGSEWNSRIWDQLTERVRSGVPASELAYGEPFFDYLHRTNPAAGAAFDAAMTAGSPIQALFLPDRLFDGVGHLCDVGGGTGGVVANLLLKHPALEGTVFDLPALAPRAEIALEAAGVGARARFVGGDFFEAVPASADCYTLFAVLHDWDDDACVRILKRIREAMAPGATVLVVEKSLPQDRYPDAVKTIDMLMLVLGDGGRERTAAEYLVLFERAGLRMAGQTTLPSLFEVFELAA